MTLILTHRQWNKIYRILVKELGPSGVLSWNLKKNFGYTVRYHRGQDILLNKWVDDIRLDFFNESAISMFRLKFLDILDAEAKYQEVQ